MIPCYSNNFSLKQGFLKVLLLICWNTKLVLTSNLNVYASLVISPFSCGLLINIILFLQYFNTINLLLRVI